MEIPRQRASAIVKREGRILLVRDRGVSSFALPGGGIDPGELAIAGVARELREETTLEAHTARFLFQHPGKRNNHHVFVVDAHGEVNVDSDQDVEEFTWWNPRDQLPVFPHVTEIVTRLQIDIDGQSVRQRATAIVIQGDKILLVRGSHDLKFGLPGGGVESGETPGTAVARELAEETGLMATSADFLFGHYEHYGDAGIHCRGVNHNVFRVQTGGQIELGNNVEEFSWWDGTGELPLRPHVTPIMDQLRGS